MATSNPKAHTLRTTAARSNSKISKTVKNPTGKGKVTSTKKNSTVRTGTKRAQTVIMEIALTMETTTISRKAVTVNHDPKLAKTPNHATTMTLVTMMTEVTNNQLKITHPRARIRSTFKMKNGVIKSIHRKTWTTRKFKLTPAHRLTKNKLQISVVDQFKVRLQTKNPPPWCRWCRSRPLMSLVINSNLG